MLARLLAVLGLLFLLSAACASGPSTATPSARRPTATPLPPTTTPAVSPTPTEAPPIADRIAYVGEDGSIHVLRLGSGEDVMLTAADARGATWYAWPTWDPTGAWLAFSRYVGTDAEEEIALVVERADGTETRVLDTRLLGPSDPLVITGAPHYVQWSPTGAQLAFLAPKSGGILALGLASNAEGATAEEITEGASINFTWDRRGTVLYLHHGEALAAVDTALPVRPAPLGPRSNLGGIPVQSPHSPNIAYLDETGQGDALFVGDIAAIHAGTATAVLPVQGQAAFLWSPARELLALAASGDPDSFEHEGLSIVDPSGNDSRQLVDETVLAFFWSPDGTKIAYVTPAEERGVVRLKVVPASGGATRTVATFSPTQEMAVYFSFFDQFAHSHSLWSADSRRLVVALREENGTSSIQVADAEGTEAPRTVAQGGLAFWSPR